MELVKPGDPLSPVAAATIGPLASVGVVLIRFDHLSHPDQPLDQAHEGLNYVLTPPQARDVARKIAEALAVLDTDNGSGERGPAH